VSVEVTSARGLTLGRWWAHAPAERYAGRSTRSARCSSSIRRSAASIVCADARLGLLWGASVQRAYAEHVGRARHYRWLDRTTGNVRARRRLAAVPAVHPAAMIGGL
jgi:hypothetical protein